MNTDEVHYLLKHRYIPTIEDGGIVEVMEFYLPHYIETYKNEETLRKFVGTYQQAITSFVSFIYGITNK